MKPVERVRADEAMPGDVELAGKFGRTRARSVRRASAKAVAAVDKRHVIGAAVEDNAVAAHVATILLGKGTSAHKTSEISKFLAPLGISKQAVITAFSMTSKGRATKPGIPDTATLPNSSPSRYGLNRSTPVMDAARKREAYYRATYLINAAQRIQDDLDGGKPIRVALADESLHYRQHEVARRGRLDSAAKASKAAATFGPLLGWYLNPALNNDRECIAANGHNFDALAGTVIGFPGAVHPHCGCVAGPPHEGGAENSVDKAVIGEIRFGKPKTYKQKAS